MEDSTSRSPAPRAPEGDPRETAAAAASPRQCAKLLDHITENVTVLDAEGRVLFSTPTLTPLLGYGPAEVLGRNSFEALHPGDRSRAESIFSDVSASPGAVVRQLLRVESASGAWVTLECTARNLLADPDVRGIVITSRDVTDEIANQERLARREEQLRLVLNQMPCLLWTTDRDLVITSMRGRTSGSTTELLGRQLGTVAPDSPGAREMIDCHVDALDGTSGSYAVTIEGIPFEAQVEPLRAGGEITGTIGVALDVSRYVETENNLRMQREVLQRILDNLPLMVALYDGAGNFIWTNRCWTETVGWTLEDTWRRDFLQHMVQDSRQAEKFRRIIAEGTGDWRDLQLTTREGAVMTVSWCSVRLPDGTCVGLGQDVTDVRRAADHLRESEERYRLLVESSNQVFYYIHDLDGIFQYVSPSVSAVLGYSPDELVGLSFDAVVPEPELAEVMARTRAAFEARVAHPPYIALNRRRDGSLIQLEITESPLIRDGVVIGMQGFGRDITHVRRLEEQVQQAQKMEAVGRLAGGVAHDFNNILTVIDGNADIALHEPALAEAVRESLEQIRIASERGARLTRQLLAFSRKQVVQRSTLDLNDVVVQMHSMLRRLIGGDIVLRLDVAPAPSWIVADAGQLEQVLLNLAVNARAAMPGGGELRIVTRAASPQDSSRPLAGEWVLLEVADTGHGIEPTVLPHIFEPFFTTRESGEGTGLGLATSYAIIEASGGWIEVASQPGDGARFRIFLPRTDAPRGAAPAHATPAVSGGAETILLAEDDPAVRGVVRHTLRRLGYTLLEAEHGAAALETLREQRERVALLITDVIMPVMGGTDLVRRARELQPQLPVLFISGYTDDAPDLGHSGSAPLLNKPFTAGQLAGAVRALLDGARVPPT